MKTNIKDWGKGINYCPDPPPPPPDPPDPPPKDI